MAARGHCFTKIHQVPQVARFRSRLPPAPPNLSAAAQDAASGETSLVHAVMLARVGKEVPRWGHVRLHWGGQHSGKRAAASWRGFRLVCYRARQPTARQVPARQPTARQVPAQPAAAATRDAAARRAAASEALRLVKAHCQSTLPGLAANIDRALAVSEPCAVCLSVVTCLVLHPCGHVLCQACLGPALVCPASSCGDALQGARPQWAGSFERLRTRAPLQLRVLGSDGEDGDTSLPVPCQ